MAIIIITLLDLYECMCPFSFFLSSFLLLLLLPRLRRRRRYFFFFFISVLFVLLFSYIYNFLFSFFYFIVYAYRNLSLIQLCALSVKYSVWWLLAYYSARSQMLIYVLILCKKNVPFPIKSLSRNNFFFFVFCCCYYLFVHSSLFISSTSWMCFSLIFFFFLCVVLWMDFEDWAIETNTREWYLILFFYVVCEFVYTFFFSVSSLNGKYLL